MQSYLFSPTRQGHVQHFRHLGHLSLILEPLQLGRQNNGWRDSSWIICLGRRLLHLDYGMHLEGFIRALLLGGYGPNTHYFAQVDRLSGSYLRTFFICLLTQMSVEQNHFIQIFQLFIHDLLWQSLQLSVHLRHV